LNFRNCGCLNAIFNIAFRRVHTDFIDAVAHYRTLAVAFAVEPSHLTRATSLRDYKAQYLACKVLSVVRRAAANGVCIAVTVSQQHKAGNSWATAQLVSITEAASEAHPAFPVHVIRLDE
jgi:hypothetical protein